MVLRLIWGREQQPKSRFETLSDKELAEHLHAALRTLETADRVDADRLRATPNLRDGEHRGRLRTIPSNTEETSAQQIRRNQDRADNKWKDKRQRHLIELEELCDAMEKRAAEKGGTFDFASLFKSNTGPHNVELLQKYRAEIRAQRDSTTSSRPGEQTT
jgi:hypothetical protein